MLQNEIRKQTRVTLYQNKGEHVDKDTNEVIDKTEMHDAEPSLCNNSELNTLARIEEAFQVNNETMTEETISKLKQLTVEEFAASHDAGAVDLAFPNNLQYESSTECYPRSYYTLTGKERLLLLFAENFRKQFINLYPERRPLVLSVKNECDVQKLVCTTIRPTSFVYQPLIASLEGCASFVADFIEYEPLEKPSALPPRLVSPATLLRRRHGNSFEMATLLCSMLIGAGFPAMVVSGSAKSETINNDQRNVEFSLPKYSDPSADDEDNRVEVDNPTTSNKYKIKLKPDLTSHLTEKLEAIKLAKEQRERLAKNEAARIERETLEDEISFNDPHRLSHAWVVVVNNAPWTIKPRVHTLNEDGEEVDEAPTAVFIEPSTGFKHDTSSKAYIHIESVWNHMNYYVNLQQCRICDMKWDLRETSQWEHLLPGEPEEMRVAAQISDENLPIDDANNASVEKHLDMSPSWVEKLHISHKEFDERFPNLYKAISYRRVLQERFSPHMQADGKTLQVTLFADDMYKVPEVRWDWYENRSDLMTKVKFVFSTGQTEEYFVKGRPDSLKYFIHNVDDKKPKFMHFFSMARLDALRFAEIHVKKVILGFEKSPGSCFYKEFVTKNDMTKLKEITEKFERNPTELADNDIAIRSFLLAQNKIVLKFHYKRGALTASTREFIKPPRPDYGQEIIFDPELTIGYKSGGSSVPDPTQLQLYLLLLEQLKAEERAKKSFEKHTEELNGIFELRQNERKHTILKYRCFDPLRNSAARNIRLELDQIEEQAKKDRRDNQPDYLAPYLIRYGDHTLTPQESWAAYNECLNDIKTRYISLLNKLQRRYEDLTAEAQSLKKFLNKFQVKFDDFDYERLKGESKDLELNKRVVQKRLTMAHEEGQKKYDMVKQALLKDKRLNLKRSPII